VSLLGPVPRGRRFSSAEAQLRHPGESRGPGSRPPCLLPWIPAFAGMTPVVFSRRKNRTPSPRRKPGSRGKHTQCSPPLDPGVHRDDESVCESIPPRIPARQTSLTLFPPRPSEGRFARRCDAGRGAVPAGLVATRHSGGIGAPPGTTRSPCQELTDATGGGVRSDLLDESGARCRKTSKLARREAPAVSGNGYGHHRFASFGAPPPRGRVGNGFSLPTRNELGGHASLCPPYEEEA
jgi:hypothetical protein